MRTGRLVLLYVLNVAAISFGAFVNFQYNWPDFVHTNYGFPFVWATHTTITIAGPVDTWNVNLGRIFINILSWLSICFLAYWGGVWMTTGHSR